MELAIITLKHEWVAEVVLIVAEVLTFDQKSTILGPGIEISRSCYHHSLCALVTCRLILITCIECIVKLACLIIDGRTSTDGSILRLQGATRNQFTQSSIVGSILGTYTPDGVVSAFRIRTEVLQIQHLEIASHWIEERHRVAYIAHSRLVISILCCCIG